METEFTEDLLSDRLDSVLDSEDRLLPLNRAMNAHGIRHESLKEWAANCGRSEESLTQDDLADYCGDLMQDEPYERFIEQTTDEIFFVMFLNRSVLQSLNRLIADVLVGEGLRDATSETQVLFRRPGLLARKYIPQWARRAVFFRDRGRCVFCGSDISGLVSLNSQENLDHIIPLSQGGINDVTNLQLLCDTCNLRKSDRNADTSCIYERWYGTDEQ